jgi:DNA-binding transcriptional LysR family regulator
VDRSKLLNDVWSYLPAFRAVAETEHLPTAAARLHVVPSALSRSVRLLEEAMGGEVFERRGRRLALNARGRALLEALRHGTMALERGLARASGDALEGDLLVGTIGVLTNHVVLPVLLGLVERWPRVIPSMRTCGPKEANHRLAIGNLDLAFYYDAIPMDGIWCERLGALSASIYCGVDHPLFGVRRVDRALLSTHPFSVPQIGDRNVPMDGWPVHLPRAVGFRIELLYSNLDVCLSGRFITVLPDIVAAPYLAAGRLRMLADDLVPPIEVFAAARAGEEGGALVADVLRGVRAGLEGAASAPRRGPRGARRAGATSRRAPRSSGSGRPRRAR